MADTRPHVLYVSYNGLTEPLGASQVVPYVDKLSRDYRFTLVSFEKPGGAIALPDSEVAEWISKIGGRWYPMRYHRGLGLLSKAWDFGRGVRAVRSIIKRDPPQLIHARGYVPAAIADRARRGSRSRLLFDVRGLQAEESVDAGTWREGDLRFRLTKRFESALFASVDGIVTLTEAVRPYLQGQPGLRGRDLPWEVIPCCVDLDLFQFDATAREERRRLLGVRDDQRLFVYSGSIGTWYATEESCRLVAGGRSDDFLLFLSFGDAAQIHEICKRAGLAPNRYAVRSARRSDIPRWLSAGDVALCLVKPSFSKIASSPTKIAEALACGLPVLTFRKIGDCDAIASDKGPVFTVERGGTLPPLQTSGNRDVARTLAETHFSLEIGTERYGRIYSRLIGR